jgi:hypothetical protein
MTSTDDILALIRRALDEFEDRALESSLRRAIRIANLLGDSRTAIRLGLELKPTGGDSAANAEDTRRLMENKDQWADPNGPTEQALAEFISDRTMQSAPGNKSALDGKVLAHSLGEFEFWDQVHQSFGPEYEEPNDGLLMRLASCQATLRVRHRCFTALCQWERQLTYANVNERIFTRFKDNVDTILSSGAPELLIKFSAVYRRLREAAKADPNEDVSEELTQALTTCRRILEAVVSHVFPPEQPVTLADGTQADASKYRARLKEFTKGIASQSYRAAINAEVSGLYDRFEATDKLTNKAVHANVALGEAEMCAILTYVLAGEILRLHEQRLLSADMS